METRLSPNRSARAAGVPVSLVVVHATAGSFGSSLAWLCDPRSQVSAHYLISEDGGRVVQLVPESETAWHAGASAWPGAASVGGSLNAASIGIELAHSNRASDPWPAGLVAAAADLIADICRRNPAVLPDRRHIVGHAEIALPRGRKSDPAGLSLDALVAAVQQRLQPGLPGAAGQLLRCSAEVAAFYARHGGVVVFGYPVAEEYSAPDSAGELCRWLRCENGVIKVKPSLPVAWRIRLAPLDEVTRRATP